MFSRSRRRGEEGTSSIELVLYMPLLMIAIIITIQFALIYLGNQVASASAREAARVARVSGDAEQGKAKGLSYADYLGGGVLENVSVNVVQVGDDEMRVTVSGSAPQLLPFLKSPRVTEEVEGPIEEFREDNG